MFITENKQVPDWHGNTSDAESRRNTGLPDRTDEFDVFDEMQGVSLDQISSIRLMDRVDSKYVLPLSKLGSVIRTIAPLYYIQEIDGIRIASYETTYYDYPDMQFFHNHINGKLNRCKVRKREYVDCNLQFLEVKRKTNKGQTIKNRIKLNGNEGNFERNAYKLVDKYANADLFLLFAILKNHFKRVTLVDREMTERVTIDFNLDFKKAGEEEPVFVPNLAIIEIKQDKSRKSPVRNALFNARIRKFGISKYCLGVALTRQDEKLNVLKKKLRKIQRITNYEYYA